MSYDKNNIFAKILRGEIPYKKIYADEYALAFHDIAPSAPVHVLVVPRGDYSSYDDFIAKAPPAEIAGFFHAVRNVTHELGVGDAFRLISNNGSAVGQSVAHFHVHILAGRTLGPLVADQK